MHTTSDNAYPFWTHEKGIYPVLHLSYSNAGLVCMYVYMVTKFAF